MMPEPMDSRLQYVLSREPAWGSYAWLTYCNDPRRGTPDDFGAFSQAIVTHGAWDEELIDVAYRYYCNGINYERLPPRQSFEEAICCASKSLSTTSSTN